MLQAGSHGARPAAEPDSDRQHGRQAGCCSPNHGPVDIRQEVHLSAIRPLMQAPAALPMRTVATTPPCSQAICAVAGTRVLEDSADEMPPRASPTLNPRPTCPAEEFGRPHLWLIGASDGRSARSTPASTSTRTTSWAAPVGRSSGRPSMSEYDRHAHYCCWPAPRSARSLAIIASTTSSASTRYSDRNAVSFPRRGSSASPRATRSSSSCPDIRTSDAALAATRANRISARTALVARRSATWRSSPGRCFAMSASSTLLNAKWRRRNAKSNSSFRASAAASAFCFSSCRIVRLSRYAATTPPRMPAPMPSRPCSHVQSQAGRRSHSHDHDAAAAMPSSIATVTSPNCSHTVTTGNVPTPRRHHHPA